jgi:sugar lactone lactonase YvrE
MKVKALCVSILAIACTVSAQAQNISSVVGGNAGVISGKTATAVSAYSPTAVAFDALGNAYFATANSVYKLSVNGILTLVAGNGAEGYSGDGAAATSATLNWPEGVAVDNSGNLYIADTDNCVIRKVVLSSGIISTVAGNGSCSYTGDGGPATSATLYYPQGLAVDSSGNLYIADSDNNVIREVSSGNISTVAGTGSWGYSGDGAAATSATLDYPEGVAVDSSGNIYIADTYNNVIRMVAGSNPPSGDTAGDIYTVAGTGNAGYTGDRGAATSAELCYPQGVAVDNSGNIYIADTSNSAIRVVAGSRPPSGDTAGDIYTVAGNGRWGYTGDGGAATGAELNYPLAVAVNSSGNLYIADENNYVIREVSSGTISTVAGNGYYSYSGDGGLAANAQLYYPMGTAVDGAGNVYIADYDNYVVRKVDAITGIISTVAGNGIDGYTGDGGAATKAEVGEPVGVAVDNSGNLYISDYSNNVVRKVVLSTGRISTFAGNGDCSYGGDGSDAIYASLCEPQGIALDSSGNLYIADADNVVIREVDASTGVISTVAGNNSWGYSGDGGPATSAQLDWPTDVALDASGNLYIADSENQVIREVSLNATDTTDHGNIQTVAGSGGTNVTTTAQSALGVYFDWPSGVFVDYAGNIFVTDEEYDGVYEVTGSSFTSPANGQIFTVAGNGSWGYLGDGGPATSAELYDPYFAKGDFNGNLLISDTYNYVIRSVGGIVTTAPESVLSANDLSFATQLLKSSASSTQTITVSDPGNTAVTISTITITGTNAADFTETDDCAGQKVAATKSCAIKVTFVATVAGGESATLTINSNAVQEPVKTVALSGAGISFASPIAASSGGSTSATVAAGTTASFGLQINATGGATASDSLTLSLTCTGAPTDAVCVVPS